MNRFRCILVRREKLAGTYPAMLRFRRSLSFIPGGVDDLLVRDDEFHVFTDRVGGFLA